MLPAADLTEILANLSALSQRLLNQVLQRLDISLEHRTFAGHKTSTAFLPNIEGLLCLVRACRDSTTTIMSNPNHRRTRCVA